MKNTKKFKVAVIHHNNDMDGFISGCLARRYFDMYMGFTGADNIEVDIIGYDYEKTVEEASWLNLIDEKNNLKYDYIQFIDCTPPIKFLHEYKDWICDGELKIHIFDHHEAACQKILLDFVISNRLQDSKQFKIFFNKETCGAKIYWSSLITHVLIPDFFSKGLKHTDSLLGVVFDSFNNKKILKDFQKSVTSYFVTTEFANFIQLVNDYDLWFWYNNMEPKGWNAMYLNEFLTQIYRSNNPTKSIDVIYQQFFLSPKFMPNEMIQAYLNRGESIAALKEDFSKQTKIVVYNMLGKTIAIIQGKVQFFETERVINEYPNVDGVLYYSFDLEKQIVTMSLRQCKKHFDCNVFVRLLVGPENGGGHPGAAGGAMSIIEFLNQIQSSKIIK